MVKQCCLSVYRFLGTSPFWWDSSQNSSHGSGHAIWHTGKCNFGFKHMKMIVPAFFTRPDGILNMSYYWIPIFCGLTHINQRINNLNWSVAVFSFQYSKNCSSINNRTDIITFRNKKTVPLNKICKFQDACGNCMHFSWWVLKEKGEVDFRKSSGVTGVYRSGTNLSTLSTVEVSFKYQLKQIDVGVLW